MLLAQPININGMELANRIVMLPMVTNLAGLEGENTEQLMNHYRRRAGESVGLVIVESTPVDGNYRNCVNGPGIWSDEHVKGLSQLAAAIKEKGSAASLQIFHAGARTYADMPGVSCSGIALKKGRRPEQLALEDLPAVIDQFASAALRVRQAGFDAVEVHVAHFYLLSEFLSPLTNKRSDDYGGSPENRARLATEVVSAVRRAVGSDFPIVLRMHGYEAAPGGLTDADIQVAVRMLTEAGVDLFSVSANNRSEFVESGEGGHWSLRPYLYKHQPAGSHARYAGRIRELSGKPVIVAGKMADPQVAEQVLAAGQADLIGIGRNFLCDEELGAKMLGRSDSKIKTCRECMLCLKTTTEQQRPIRCAINRDVGRN